MPRDLPGLTSANFFFSFSFFSDTQWGSSDKSGHFCFRKASEALMHYSVASEYKENLVQDFT
jgi:hypothetical protein